MWIAAAIPAFVLRQGLMTGADEFPGHDLMKWRVSIPQDGHSYFIPPETAAIPVGGGGGAWVTMNLPHQAIKTSISAMDIMREDEHFPDTMDEQTLIQRITGGALGRRVAAILKDHDDRFTFMENWMAAQVLRGFVSYSYPGRDSFIIDYGKPVTHEAALVGAARWNTGTQNIFADVSTARKAIAASTNQSMGLAIMGPGVAELFLASADVRTNLNTLNVRAGVLQLDTGVENAGTLQYYGNIYGVDWWSMDQEVVFEGSSTPLIRANTVEFVANTSNLNNHFAYAPLPDFDYHTTDVGGTTEVLRKDSKRASKAWGDQETSGRWIRSATMGAPVIKYPGFVYSLLVV